MAGTRLDEIKDYPFPVRFYKEYLDSTDPQQASAAREIQRLIKTGQINSEFRTTTKFDRAQSTGTAQKEFATKQSKEALTAGSKKVTTEIPSPFAGTVIEEIGKAAKAKADKAAEARAAEERRRNELAAEQNRSLPFPDRAQKDAKERIKSGTTYAPTGTPATKRGMTPTEIALKARPELAQNYWDALKGANVQFDGGKLILEDGNIGYIGVDVNGNSQIISQTKFLQNIRSMSVEERKQFQNKIKSAYGSAYDGPTNGTNDFAGNFENAAQAFMERFTQINYDNFNANGMNSAVSLVA